MHRRISHKIVLPWIADTIKLAISSETKAERHQSQFFSLQCIYIQNNNFRNFHRLFPFSYSHHHAVKNRIYCPAGLCPFKGKVKTDKFAGKFVFDLLKPALNSAEALAIESSKGANAYPTLAAIPATKFDCSSKAGPGFYANVETQCQVFHRCELSGNVTDYLCVNTTIFNQITLICDKWYNVDCGRSLELEDFANSRLYTDKPLFDSPPAGYIAPSQQLASTVNVASSKPAGRADDSSAAAAPPAPDAAAPEASASRRR